MSADESWKITDLFTGEDLPARAGIPYPGEPSEWWLEGWNDAMDGLGKRITTSYSVSELREYEEGYEAAERD